MASSETLTEVHRSTRGHTDFSILWTGRGINQFGSAIGSVAFPLVAVGILDAGAMQVSVLAALTTVTILVLSFPVGVYTEYRYKRPIMVAADLLRFSALASVAVAGYLELLSFPYLCGVAVVNGACQIVYMSAAQPHVKGLVGQERLADANGKLESTNWLSISVGPSLGGVIIGWLGALTGYLIQAVSFLASAVAVLLLRSKEEPPPERIEGERKRDQLLGGFRFVRRHPSLRRVLISWILFAGGSALATPIAIVFYLNDLEMSAFQLGIILGVPSVGGFVGARFARRTASKFGSIRGLWLASLARCPWYFLVPLAVPGYSGVAVACLGFGGLLLFAGLANSIMTTYRQTVTPDHLLTRVSALWSFATTSLQPAFIVVGGIVASFASIRE